jgi:anthranilate phosphoribosyltransferase
MTETPTWPTLLLGLVHRRNLTTAEASWAMEQVMTGEATPSQIAGLLVALHAKGEAADEIDGFAASMLAHATPISIPGPALDIVGSGGDRFGTVNISTMAAVVCAAAGVKVVKHGNRSASSECGSADVLEELGLPMDLSPDAVAELADAVGITFCFATTFHPSMRHARPARSELGIPTVFNFLGPLANPAQPEALAVGCSAVEMAPLMAEVLARRGNTALVAHGDDGLDEITTTDTTSIWLIGDGQVRTTSVDPDRLGLSRVSIADLRGGDAKTNARIVHETLGGAPGAIRETVLLNAAAGIAMFRAVGTAASLDERVDTLHDDLTAGMTEAAAAIDSGAAAALLDRWIAASRDLSAASST